jgi:O-acetylhomoserine/O-acetylserine sulfhydrylase-like pyridoxal-dependent enzyme
MQRHAAASRLQRSWRAVPKHSERGDVVEIQADPPHSRSFTFNNSQHGADLFGLRAFGNM